MGAIRLLEREALLGRLVEHAEASRRGSGRLVFVGGEAGAGKTSLVERFARHQPAGTEVRWGACESMAAPTPLGPLFDVANELVEEAEELIGWRARRYRLFSSVLASLKATTNLQLLVFEDLHWADEATFDLLRFLGRRLGDARVLLIGTYRDDELGPEHGLRRLLGDLAAATTVHRLSVPPLTLAAVSELASELSVDPVELHERTKGNPFFVTEVLAAGGGRLPEKVGDAVAARLSRLSPAGRRALELASVLLRLELDAHSLSALVPDPAAIDECVLRGLLVGNGRDLGFRHELVREAVETSMPPSRRRAAHAAILARLEADDPAFAVAGGGASRRDRLSALAHHAYEAGDGPAVLRYATAAGKLAMKYQANREALIQFSRALPLAGSLPPEARAQLYQDHAKVCCVTCNFVESVEPSDIAVSLWREAGRGAKAAQALLLQSAAYFYLGRDADSVGAIKEAEELVAGRPKSGQELATAGEGAARDRTLALDSRAMVLLERGLGGYPNVAVVEEWALRAEECWREEGGNKAHAVMNQLHAAAQVARGNYKRALGLARRSIEIATAHDYDDLMATTYQTIGALLQARHRYRQSDRGLDEVIELGRNWDAEYLVEGAQSLKCISHLHQGRWQLAEEAASGVLAMPKASVGSRLRALLALGRLRVRRGAPNALELLEEAAGLASRVGRGHFWLRVQAALSEQAWTEGDDELALERARLALDGAGGAGTLTPRSELAYWRWKAGARAEPPTGAADPHALQLQGRSAAAARRWRRLACPYEEALALTEGDDADGLLRAHELFSQLGAKPAMRRVVERLGRSGVARSPRAAAAGPPGLTPRERQVLELMRKGLRNSEIARANKVSPRTVDHQVSAVLAKLGARTRTEAVSLADHLGIEAE